MLKSLRLKNYKGFTDTDFLEIRPITLILGKNSSGKSSLCKLFPILRDALANPDRMFPLKSEEGVCLSQRYENLFHNHDFTELGLMLIFDEGYFMESHYMISNGVFCNYRSIAGKGKIRRGLVSPRQEPKGDIRRAGKFFDRTLLNSVGLKAARRRLDVNFIGPIRCEAPDTLAKVNAYINAPKDDKGAFAYRKLMESKLTDGRLLNKVSRWFEENMDGQKLELRFTDTFMTHLAPYIVRDKVALPLAEVGEGVTQVLPIITQSFIPSHGTISVLEQPVLHLHPAAHAKVAERLAVSAKTTGQRFVIESHSNNLMLGFIRMVASRETDFTPDDIIIYFLESDTLPFSVKKIEVLEDGTLTEWPYGIFEESVVLQEQILERR